MKVRDLIARLQDIDPDADVCAGNGCRCYSNSENIGDDVKFHPNSTIIDLAVDDLGDGWLRIDPVK